MNNRRKSLLLPILIGAGVLLAVTIGVTFFYNRPLFYGEAAALAVLADRKSTRLNSSHNA